ncbi:hypothetical protein L3Y34_000109 [Caenorhabditis briggsae]|uniref:Uncharacterized protein n=1 Tax=Caenorhabditis briggsae TaxID=6238 RepID=A0AAE9ILJ2_CAEBR|nr:hypothetical protein L3Y34_000109 [Caenorhabditis briggsae]
MTVNGCGLRQEIVLRSLSVVHILLVVSNFFVLDPRVFTPLYVIYSIGVVCFFTLFIYSFVNYQAWFFVVALCFQGLYIISAGYLASLALMGYFTIKMTLMCVVFGTNTLVIITDAKTENSDYFEKFSKNLLPTTLPCDFQKLSQEMAYVESFYLEPNEAAEPTIPNEIVELQKVVESENRKPSPDSDYCGFESDEIPPIYRAQLRTAQKNKILAAENAEKSMYAYGSDEKMEVKPKNLANGPQSVEYYVPGFSPPPQADENNEIHKRNDFSLPKFQPIEATENVFNILGKHEKSQYILMESEEDQPQKLAPPTKSVIENLTSYTDAGSTIATSSCLTASLGPPYGYVPVQNQRQTEEKYKGLSAFRPVTQSAESQYASAELN